MKTTSKLSTQHSALSTLSDAQRRRYARHLVLPEIGEAGQAKLLAAKVLVIGAGGLGSPLLSYLAAAGVGQLGIVDGDRVELSNLQRQILHETAEIGRLKAESAKSRLEELNPDVQITTYNERLDEANAERLISAYDLVADGSDNFPTRFLVHDTCYRLGKTLVSAAVIGFTGQLSTFKAHLGPPHPCYRCFIPEEPPRAQNCSETGVLGPLTGVLGSWQAAEVMKEILGMGESLSGKLLTFNALSNQSRKIALVRDSACVLHS